MNTHLQSYNFNGHALRVFPSEDGQSFYAVAKDATDILGYREAKDGLRRVPDKHKGRRSVPTLGGNQEMLCVDEAGLYRLILRSDKPEAEPFMEWVTSEVLPSIRKTGGYGVNRLSSGPMTLAQYHAHQRTITAYQQELLGAQIVFTGADLAALKITPQWIDLALGEHENEPTIADTIIQMHKDGCTRQEISVRIGRSRNYVRQILFHANKKGLLSESHGVP